MRNLLQLLFLGILTQVPSLTGSPELEYIWKETAHGDKYCTKIPADLRLCHGVGYTGMLLPNLLEHETMAEVKQQASSWVPLVHRRCHMGTQIFLCALFAPLCLETAIRPCRSLCTGVRDACSPIMEAFGFPWPPMFNCSRFPREEEEVCINMNDTNAMETSDGTTVCPPCDERNTDIILEHMCASEFAIKSRIKKAVLENLDKKVTLQRKKKLVKEGDLKNKPINHLKLYLRNGAQCSCPQLELHKQLYLIMGRKVGHYYLITSIHAWDRKRFKKVLNNHQCSALGPGSY